MKKVIIYSDAQGIAVVVHVPPGGDEDDRIAAALAALPKDAAYAQVVDAAAVPADRLFRGAWTVVPNGIEHDMAKARDIAREHLRRHRAPLLEDLDVDFMRATERGDQEETARIAARKQQLRDVTAAPAIDAATTPAELCAALSLVGWAL